MYTQYEQDFSLQLHSLPSGEMIYTCLVSHVNIIPVSSSQDMLQSGPLFDQDQISCPFGPIFILSSLSVCSNSTQPSSVDVICLHSPFRIHGRKSAKTLLVILNSLIYMGSTMHDKMKKISRRHGRMTFGMIEMLVWIILNYHIQRYCTQSAILTMITHAEIFLE